MTIPTGYSQVNLVWTGAAAPSGAQTVFGVLNSTALTPNAIAAAVNTIVIARIVPQLLNAITYSGCNVKNGPDLTGPFGGVGASSTPAASTAAASPNVTYLLVKQTALGGREGRGRMFLPCVGEANVDASGNVAGATITALATAFASVLSDLTAANLPMQLLHKSATSPTPVTSIAVSTKVATQRRRLRR